MEAQDGLAWTDPCLLPRVAFGGFHHLISLDSVPLTQSTCSSDILMQPLLHTRQRQRAREGSPGLGKAAGNPRSKRRAPGWQSNDLGLFGCLPCCPKVCTTSLLPATCLLGLKSGTGPVAAQGVPQGPQNASSEG